MADIEKIQSNAQSIAKAGSLVVQAGRELAPVASSLLAHAPKVLAPVITAITMRVPGAAGSAVKKYMSLSEVDRKRAKTALTAAGGVAAAGLVVATGAHFRYRRKAVKHYRANRKEQAAEKKQLMSVETQLAEACEHVNANVFENRYAANEAGNASVPIDHLHVPGCVVILTYAQETPAADFMGYRDVLVCKGDDMAEVAHKHLSGNGNVYVHADMVYSQPVFAFFYPCDAEKLQESFDELVEKFGANASYNRIE